MLLGVNRVKRVKGLGIDGVTGNMLAPVIKSDTPGIGAVVGAKGGEPVVTGLKAEPAAVLLANRAVGGLNLGMVEDGLAEDDVAIGRPDKVMQGVMGVLTAEAGEDFAAVVGLAISIGCLLYTSDAADE